MNWPDSFIEQDAFKARMTADIKRFLTTGERLPHYLFTGPPGTGKSMSVRIIADQLDIPCELAMPSSNLEEIMAEIDYKWHGEKGILFVDELPEFKRSQTVGLLPLTDGRGIYVTRNARINLPNLSIIGATTEPSKIKRDLRSRLAERSFSRLSIDGTARVIKSYAFNKYEYKVDEILAAQVAKLARGNARKATDLSEIAYTLSFTSQPTAEQVASHAGLTLNGLSEMAESYVSALWHGGRGKPLKGSLIAASLGIELSELEPLEKELITTGYLTVKTGVGRILTDDGRALAKTLPE